MAGGAYTGRMASFFFARRLKKKKDVGQHGKLLISSFVEFVCVRVSGHTASLPFCVKRH